ncbi:Response regulator protein GraR [Clostridiales bacterium CHKCI001]|nr:Response regulator protein GraR [Clostridiales bacterium CHKCI001]
MQKIVIVEDDPTLRNELKHLLINNGYDVYQLLEYKNAAEKIIEFTPDLILLDIMLPGANGQAILREIRENSEIPIIMLTSKTTEVDEIMSMSYGADDYITKPYNPTLLLLRIQALLKRSGKQLSQEQLNYRGVTLNLLRSSIQYQDQEVILSKNELMIFYFLLQHEGEIVSRDDLMDYLWDYNNFVDDNTLTVNINRLRKRLSEIGLSDVIQTRRKQGYLLV